MANMDKSKKEEVKKDQQTEGNHPEVNVSVPPPKYVTAEFHIRGTAPYVQNAFSSRIHQEYAAKQREGGTAKGRKTRAPKDFERLYEEAQHVSLEGWHGIPCSAFRNALISACRTVGYKMTHAKLAAWCIADGYSRNGRAPLVRLTKGSPQYFEAIVRNQTGVIDVRARPMFEEWEAKVRIEFDSEMMSLNDVANLMRRVGKQVGIGEGRPDSKDSAGMGWGTFEVLL